MPSRLAVRPLTEVGLEPVVFKGPAVAARYPEPGLRPMDDIDLLLPRADHTRAIDALGHAGWQVARAGVGDHYDTVLTHPEVPSLFLEVHFGLEGGAEQVTALDPELLWSLRRPLECAGTAAFGLPPAEELVVLAAHAGKPHHRFVRLVWMADLAMIVGHDPAIDWDRVHAVARAARCVTVVGTALEMARRAGVDTPVGLFPLPTRGSRGDTMRRLLSVTWPLTQRELPAYRFNYALTDSRARRANMRFLHLVLGHGVRARARRAVGLPPRTRPRLTPGVDHQPQLNQLAHRLAHVLTDVGRVGRVHRRQLAHHVVERRRAVAALPDGGRTGVEEEKELPDLVVERHVVVQLHRCGAATSLWERRHHAWRAGPVRRHARRGTWSPCPPPARAPVRTPRRGPTW